MLPCRRFADVSRTPAHGSGPMWVATPSSQWTFTTYSLPVGPVAHSLALRPAHSRRHLYVTSYTEGFSHFVTSMTAPVASGWSGWPGGACTRWKAPPWHGARKQRSFPAVVVNRPIRPEAHVQHLVVEVRNAINSGHWIVGQIVGAPQKQCVPFGRNVRSIFGSGWPTGSLRRGSDGRTSADR